MRKLLVIAVCAVGWIGPLSAQEKTFWATGQVCEFLTGQTYVSSRDDENRYSEIVGSTAGMHSRMCVKQAGFFDFRSCKEVTLYGFRVMCRGGLVTLPQFYMAAFGNSEHSRAAGLSLNAAGDQLSYADPGDGFGAPPQRIDLPTGYAPLPPFETQIRKLRWDQANKRPAISELLSSDQEDRIKQLFVVRGDFVEPFPESYIRRAAGIAAERPPVAVSPPPPALSPPPIVERPSPTMSVPAPPQSKNPGKPPTLILVFVSISVSVLLVATIVLAYLGVLFQPISLALLGISVVGGGILFSQTSTYVLAKASYLNSWEQPLSALESVEDHNSAKPHARVDQLELSIKPNALSAPVLSGLIERMERYKTPSDIVEVLRFALYLKRGDKRAAHYVVGKINSVVAKQIVQTMQARSDLEGKLVTAETEESEEIERELERLEALPQCERMIEMGELAPLGLGSCQLAQVIWWFVPISKPEKLLGAVVRGATTRAAAVIANRTRFQRAARMTSILSRYDLRRGAIQEQLRQATAREDLLSLTLLDLEMKVIVQFGKSMISAAH